MIEVRRGDIATTRAAAILRPVASDWGAVTPTMRRLEAAAGDLLAEQCRRLGELPPGSAAITPAGDLDVEFLIHVAVRSPLEPASPSIVARALLNGLRRLREWEIAEFALPPLGTGAGNLDAETAAAAMIPVLRAELREGGCPARAAIVVESDYELEVFQAALDRRTASGVDPQSGISDPERM